MHFLRFNNWKTINILGKYAHHFTLNPDPSWPKATSSLPLRFHLTPEKSWFRVGVLRYKRPTWWRSGGPWGPGWSNFINGLPGDRTSNITTPFARPVVAMKPLPCGWQLRLLIGPRHFPSSIPSRVQSRLLKSLSWIAYQNLSGVENYFLRLKDTILKCSFPPSVTAKTRQLWRGLKSVEWTAVVNLRISRAPPGIGSRSIKISLRTKL